MDRGGGTPCVPSVFPVGTTGESEEEHTACRQPSDPSNSHRFPLGRPPRVGSMGHVLAALGGGAGDCDLTSSGGLALELGFERASLRSQRRSRWDGCGAGAPSGRETAGQGMAPGAA
jgi:hypothetical protein